jgi:hypothetical protein
VDVVRHPTVGVQPCAVAAQRSRQDVFESVIVRLAIEDRLLMVTAEYDVIQTAGDVQTWGASHRH